MPLKSIQKSRRAGLLAYAAAIGAAVAATASIFAVPPLITRGAFVIYLAVVSLTTWFCGWRPGLVAIVLTSLFMAWFVLPPNDSIYISDWADILRLAVFLLVAAIIAVLHASRERAQEQAWQTEQRLSFALQCAGMGAWYADLKTGK